MEFRQEMGAGDMSVPNVVTCLSPRGQTGAIPSRLALFARPAPPAHGLDGMSPVRQGLPMLVRLGVTRFAAYHCQLQRRAIRRSQAFLRRKSMMRISDFRRGFPRCFHPMDPDEGASAWQRKRNGRDLVLLTTTALLRRLHALRTREFRFAVAKYERECGSAPLKTPLTHAGPKAPMVLEVSRRGVPPVAIRHGWRRRVSTEWNLLHA
jgi:hypothetical protein